jgi:hypothetical protein
MTQNTATPTNPFDAFPMQPSPTASPGMNYAPTTYRSSNNNAFGEPSYVNPSPGSSYQPQANIVTPNTSSSAFVQTEQVPHSKTADYGVPSNLVNMDDIFAYQNKPAQAQQTNNNCHTSLGQFQGGKQTVMNNCNTAHMLFRQLQQQQQQQYQGVFTGYEQPQQPQFNQYVQQLCYAQPGFGYQ